jgi:hypothetical protein
MLPRRYDDPIRKFQAHLALEDGCIVGWSLAGAAREEAGERAGTCRAGRAGLAVAIKPTGFIGVAMARG